ncbi:MAG: translation elongation factor Ts [Actinomycetota bacterium]|jgi:elongation factor Ts
MTVSAGEVKRLRELTGAGMMDCKRALQDADGDFDRAVELLRERGQAAAAKRAGRAASEGVVDAYIHGGGRIGAMVEINCETDFVANTEDFRALARDIAMQVAAHDPEWVSRDEVPEEVLTQERKIYEAQAREEGKPDKVIPRIVEGKLEAFYKQRCLLDQPFFRDMEGKTSVEDVVTKLGATVGENVRVSRFVRYVRGGG